jgi:UDP-N-acetylmuramate: L-alanyl-gamma-D-glutamyl-meso-diaminopimelate ligase
MHIHLVAVSGTGMGALAGLLKQMGHQVSGSDQSFDPPMGPALLSWGVDCQKGFDPAHLDPAPDVVVVGNVCRRDNVEAMAALERGLRVMHIAGALKEFVLQGTSPLVVAGTHGKTTTSAMCAFLLDRAGYAPGFLIGGLPLDFACSARPAARTKLRALNVHGGPKRRTPFVIEGDEYDTAFFEKTAKFLHYQAEVAIITSIEQDHVDIYPTFEAYREAFERFVAQIPENGLIVAFAGDAQVVEVVSKHARADVRWYALEDDEHHGVPVHWLGAKAGSHDGTDGTNAFDLYVGGVHTGRFATRLPGRHNLRNSLAALAATAEGFGATLDRLRGALVDFAGVARRQQEIGSPRGIHVVDDFAHHPTAVRETLLALRARYRDGRLVAVFEPRSATACRKLHQHAYPAAFDAADMVLIAPLGRQNLSPDERLDVNQLVTDVRERGRQAEAPASVAAIVERLVALAKPGDCIALLSNGRFGGIHEQLLQRLNAE